MSLFNNLRCCFIHYFMVEKFRIFTRLHLVWVKIADEWMMKVSTFYTCQCFTTILLTFCYSLLICHSAVVSIKDIQPYKENREKYGNGKKKKFAIAIKEIEETPFITGDPTKIEIEDNSTKTSETEINSTDNNANGNFDEVANGVSDKKEIQSEDVVKKEEDAPAVVNGKKGRGKRKANQSANSAEPKKKRGRKPKAENKTEKNVANKKQSRSKKADPVEPVEDDQNVAAEELSDLKATNSTPPLNENANVDLNDTNRTIQNLKLERIKAKAAEKEKLKEELKLAKLEKKRRERLEKLKSLPVTDSLLKDIESEIVESLSVEKTDIPRCLQALSRLDLFQVTPSALCKYPQILTTIKLCRKYKSDEKVRHKSVYLYNKFKLLFANGIDEVLFCLSFLYSC